MYRKEIVYDRATRDYAMYVDDLLIGFASTYHAAEVELDQYVYDLLEQGLIDELPAAERYGTCDEPTENGTPCGCHFLLPPDPSAIVLCPACGSSAIIEPAYA